MKPTVTRKPTTKGKSVNRMQTSSTLHDSDEIVFGEPSRTTLQPPGPHKKPNYFSLKISSKLSCTPHSSVADSMHKRHYSVSQSKPEGITPTAAYSEFRYPR